MKQVILILLIFIIGCEPKKEKINLETFLIGDIWCTTEAPTAKKSGGKLCFEFTSDAMIAGGGEKKERFEHKIVKTDYDTNTIYSELGYEGTMEGVINTWRFFTKTLFNIDNKEVMKK